MHNTAFVNSGKMLTLALLFCQAGHIASLDVLAKEFLGASSDKRKEVLSSMEDEAAKLSGPAAR